MDKDKKLSGRHDKIAQLAKSYVPEWNFDEQNPDAGTTVAMLVDDMLNHTEDNFDRVMEKHKIQYLNLFDMLKEEPISSAKSFVQFNPVSGIQEQVFVPKGTTLLADDGSAQIPIEFETDYAITAVDTNVQAIFVTDKDSDCLTCLFSGSDIQELDKGISAFDISGDNKSEHVLIIGFKRLFDDLTDMKLGLKFDTVEESDLNALLNYLSSQEISYSFVDPKGDWQLPSPTLKDKIIWLDITGYQPKLTELEGVECYALKITSQGTTDLTFSNVGVVFSETDIPPALVNVSGIDQNIQRFHLFGNPLAIYAQCGIESEAVLSRRGAMIDMKFNIDFEVVNQELTQYDLDEELKIVMKKKGDNQNLIKPDVRPDNVIIEYLSSTGWKRLVYEDHMATMFNGSVMGDVTISFKCPADMATLQEATEGYRLRLRLMRADHLYSIPNRLFCPVVSQLCFSYTYEATGIAPDVAITRNNYEKNNVSNTIGKNRSIELFFNRESEKLSMYFGFNESPAGSPISLYLEVQNSEDVPLNYTIQYLNNSGFYSIQTMDNTGGLLFSGNILMLIPSDVQKKELFGKNMYWIRFISNDKKIHENLPKIYSIIPNMVKVHNYRSRTQEFYLDDEQSDIRLQLNDQNLIKVQIHVNEYDETNPDAENWVLWKKRTHFSQRERHYSVDLSLGTVEFDKNIFAAYPISHNGASIRVSYQAYEGSRANVKVGAINQTEQSLKYISSVKNPVPAYGGYDGYNIESSYKIISNILKTRGRAVTSQDYFDIISQISYCVKQIKCVSGINKNGEKDEELLTVALLIEEYEKGNHIFSAVKDSIHKKLLKSSNIVPMGKTLMLTQPQFIPYSVKIWINCNEYDDVYELQNNTRQIINEFIDPLCGGFDGNGWKIGVLPTVKQLLAYLKMKKNDISIIRTSAAAVANSKEIAVTEDIQSVITNPFAMAVNGEHTVYVEII